ncbi:MAG: tryptophan-rich sensory protein [Alphaproteobacteria bacterium]|nr:tryptophan-rich sensory protein [Alphaproteobacteria bacterium]
MTKFQKCIWCIIALVISFLPGIFGVFFTPHGDSNLWYVELIKSGLTPPGWLFSVAWTILYALLGIALYFIIISVKKKADKKLAYGLFITQMFLNALWTYSFFGAYMPSAALVILLLLFVVSAYMARVFNTFDKRAAYCVIPYLLWLMFAFYLNAYIVLMN